jgi:hypothetical protein
MRQEQFWWEVFNRTLSSLVVAVVILLAGESAGLFHRPWSTVGKTVLAGGVWVSLRAPKLEAQPAEQEAQHQAGEGSDEPEDGKPQREV